jgi:hypothetical protein
MSSELVTLIVSHLITPSEIALAGQLQTPDKVAIYAKVSKDWQICIERHTFSSNYLYLLVSMSLTRLFEVHVENMSISSRLTWFSIPRMKRRAADMRLRKISRNIIDSSLEQFNIFF